MYVYRVEHHRSKCGPFNHKKDILDGYSEIQDIWSYNSDFPSTCEDFEYFYSDYITGVLNPCQLLY